MITSSQLAQGSKSSRELWSTKNFIRWSGDGIDSESFRFVTDLNGKNTNYYPYIHIINHITYYIYITINYLWPFYIDKFTVESFLFAGTNVFKDCKNIAGSWGSNFVGDWCDVLQSNRVFITLFKVPGCIIFWVRVTHKILEHCHLR